MDMKSRFPLAHLPTPIEPMKRLSESLGGPDLWIKRDDQTGLATGGNKTRKLEVLIADALNLGADVVLTVGAAQSNHCRQTAAAAARAGLGCVLVLAGNALPREQWSGNLFLDDLLGARVWWAGDQDPLAALESAAATERASGRVPYVIPYGGSNAVGALAYALAFQELWNQSEQMFGAGNPFFDKIVFATSSGGTQAGLVVGAKSCGYIGRVWGISVDKTGGDLRNIVTDLLVPTSEHLGLELSFDPDDVVIDDGHLGPGYGIVTSAEKEAIRLTASLEGILLDPVYTGRAMAGLLDLVRRGVIQDKERVLFWHTGGIPALFAYAGELMNP